MVTAAALSHSERRDGTDGACSTAVAVAVAADEANAHAPSSSRGGDADGAGAAVERGGRERKTKPAATAAPTNTSAVTAIEDPRLGITSSPRRQPPFVSHRARRS